MLSEPEHRYGLDELIEGFSAAAPILPTPAPAKKNQDSGNGQDHDDVFARYSAEHRHRLPLDVGERLTGMIFEGPDDSKVHPTQLSVMAALLNRGESVETATERVLTATRSCMEADRKEAATWDWVAERNDVFKMGVDWIVKNPNLSNALPEGLREQFEQIIVAGERPKLCGGGQRKLHFRGYEKNPESAAGCGKEETQNTDTKPEPEKVAAKFRFRVIRYKDMRVGQDEIPYLVHELIPAKGIVCVWGAPKCYKSFWTHDLMLHVAKGWEYHDRFVQQGASRLLCSRRRTRTHQANRSAAPTLRI
jgi:hypothetical protein